MMVRYEYWFIEYEGGMTETRWFPVPYPMPMQQWAAIVSAVKLREVEK